MRPDNARYEVMTSLDYRALRARITIVQVLELLDNPCRNVTREQWRGPCPLCHRQRCFSIHPVKQIFRCFKCDRSGNQLDLWMAVTGLPIHSATIDLCQRLGITPVELKTRNHQNDADQPQI